MLGLLQRVPPWLGRALLEGGLIVFAVLLGFLANEWREDRREQEAAQDALTRIVTELEGNLEVLKDAMPYHKEIRDALTELVAEIERGEAPAEGVLIQRIMPAMPNGVNPPLLSTVAWDFASQRGSLDVLDFETVERIARIYSIQEVGAQSTWRMIVETSFFNEDTFRERDITASITFAQLAFNELATQEEQLIFTYEAALPEIRNALDQ